MRRDPTNVLLLCSDDADRCRAEANAFMAQNFKQIPAIAFYTAIPQLISRVIHDDKDAAMVVRGILKRVLAKFPAQAMWQLGWIRLSRISERKIVGEAIFTEAEKLLRDAASKDGSKKDTTNRNMIHHKLLVASKSLFIHLQKLAQVKPSDPNADKINIAPWKGEVELVEFIPPLQAALSASLLGGDPGKSIDHFPRHVPRMRTFCPEVSVMASKARPKRLRALVVAAHSKVANDSSADVGEMHFLVKQEAKGDLRKDARVQDLNNVINRMMSHSSAGPRRSHRRLHLRTFMVTCLSEDTGILEWVPSTQSLRSLVSKSYNPQASTFSSKRRGRRITNFSDHMLRTNFDKSQDMFFKSGNPKRAGALFEELCLKAYPPVLYWWFVQHFSDPHGWYEARNRFTTTCADWSGVGHVIGLGDRHSENILVDVTNGACVHVDFDWCVEIRGDIVKYARCFLGVSHVCSGFRLFPPPQHFRQRPSLAAPGGGAVPLDAKPTRRLRSHRRRRSVRAGLAPCHGGTARQPRHATVGAGAVRERPHHRLETLPESAEAGRGPPDQGSEA